MARKSWLLALGVVPGLAAGLATACAEEIVVSNYGVAANGMPYAVALAKGFFKQNGADVTGILTSEGGGTTVRTLSAGNLAYGEINLTAPVIAMQQGADLKIISDNVQTVAEFVWAVPKFTDPDPQRPQGQEDRLHQPALDQPGVGLLVLEAAGLKPTDAELVKTGGFGEGIVALDLGAVDIAPIPEPLWSQHKEKYRAVMRASDTLPPLDNVVGVTTSKAAAARGDFLRAVLRGRRQAVEFIYANPDEAGAIIAKVYNLSPEVTTGCGPQPDLEPRKDRRALLGRRKLRTQGDGRHDPRSASGGRAQGGCGLEQDRRRKLSGR